MKHTSCIRPLALGLMMVMLMTLALPAQATTPLTLQIDVKQEAVTYGMPLSIGWEIVGGRPPYQISYQVFGRYRGEEEYPVSGLHTIAQREAGLGQATVNMTTYAGPHGSIQMKVKDSTGVIVDAWDDRGFAIIEPVVPNVISGDGYAVIKWSSTPMSGENILYAYENNRLRELARGLGQFASYRVDGLINGNTYQYFVQVYDVEALSWSVFDERFLASVIPGKAVKGDADGNGSLSVADAAAIINNLIYGLDPLAPTNADVDGDGDITIQDLQWLIEQLVR